MKPDKWLIGFISAVALWIAVLVGFDMGRASIVDSCHYFAKFREDGKVYECIKAQESTDQKP